MPNPPQRPNVPNPKQNATGSVNNNAKAIKSTYYGVFHNQTLDHLIASLFIGGVLTTVYNRGSLNLFTVTGLRTLIGSGSLSAVASLIAMKSQYKFIDKGNTDPTTRNTLTAGLAGALNAALHNGVYRVMPADRLLAHAVIGAATHLLSNYVAMGIPVFAWGGLGSV